MGSPQSVWVPGFMLEQMQNTLRQHIARLEEKIIAALDRLYAGGRNPCVLGRLAVSEIGPAGRQLAHDIFAIWTDAVAHLARESGMSQARSRHFAEDWIARVQGSLILYAANNDCTPFERTMTSLLDLAKEKA